MTSPTLTTDQCLKCNICTAACPVAAATDLFPGPKAVGPQAGRYHHPRLPLPDVSVEWCSGCGTCSQVCPHGVSVAEMNVQAKARLVEERGAPLRDRLIADTDLLGGLGTRLAPLANLALGAGPVRWLMEKALHIHRDAPMPPFTGRTFRQRMRARCVDAPPQAISEDRLTVAYFHGCSINTYEPDLGAAAIDLLERLGCRVVLPPQVCCGLPLQSNGLFDAARRHARQNVERLAPFAEAGIPIVGTSTSCTLALKHDYRAILGLDGGDVRVVAAGTYDLFEFLTVRLRGALDTLRLKPVAGRALYHAPCQLRSHGVGTPALAVLRRIPGLEVIPSEAACCGIAGTYGMKQEKYDVARAVGEPLFEQARRVGAEFVISESETCRWWIAHHTGLPTFHPVEIVARGW